MTGSARFTVVHSGAMSTIQAAPRLGARRFGVPPSGPVDPVAHAAANLALGNAADAAAIEVSLGGLTLRCDAGTVRLAWTGGDFRAVIDGQAQDSWQTATMAAGQTISLRAGLSGNWGYLAFGGTLASRLWLGSASTHRLSGLGGGALADGQTIEVAPRDGPVGAVIVRPPHDQGATLGIVIGPQDRHFDCGAIEGFLGTPIEATARFDRMGMVIDAAVPPDPVLGLVSEPAIGGAIQIDGAGRAVLLLADHQTTGGYPKIGVLGSHDTARLAQARPGQRFMLSPVSPAEAVGVARRQSAAIRAYLDGVKTAQVPIAERLASGNLISGATAGG